ncbi:hypothetical protein EJ995_06095 [Nonlabens ponticola]|uniref:DUF4157 domain-containing protein n=1 Tax=Nonlabens ponticola TaxID=2496866 RepID=A0A3S9N0X6_9FLAO|nr:hypothetical protein EJ995_06095 [Nonlabens ponticola]
MILKQLKLLNIDGITLYPFVLLREREMSHDKQLINHEYIHLRQQLELLIIPFYLWYILEYLALRLKYSHRTAYRNIVFEKEAYSMDTNQEYLESRSIWAFVKFYNARTK